MANPDHHFIRTVAFSDGSGKRQIVDAANPLPVTGSTGGGSTVPPNTLGGGTKDVASNATPEALATTTSCSRVMVTAKTTNTGWVKIGGNGSESLSLFPGDSIDIQIDDLAKIYVAVQNNGEGVEYVYEATV